MSKSNTIQYKPDPDKFDLMVHRWDSQGNLIAKNTYRKFIMDSREFYERPVGSGNLWLENNQPGGRVLYKKNEKGHIYDKEFDFNAEHVAYTAAPTGAAKLTAELEAAQAKIAALEAEAIKRERGSDSDDDKVAPTLTKRR